LIRRTLDLSALTACTPFGRDITAQVNAFLAGPRSFCSFAMSRCSSQFVVGAVSYTPGVLPHPIALRAQTYFEHEWLSEDFIAESRRVAAAAEESGSSPKKHHFVPQMYLKRWALDGKVQRTEVKTRHVHHPQPYAEVARKPNFYTLPRIGSTMDLPLKWVERHLGRIETACTRHLDVLGDWTGVISNETVKRDMCVFLGLQTTRTVSNRNRYLALIQAPSQQKRRVMKRLHPQLTSAQLDEAMQRQHSDPKEEALHLLFENVRWPVAHGLYQREWAVYRTASPIITCDDPVIFVAGPSFGRERSLGAESAAVLYPVDPFHVLVMLRPGFSHRGPYRLSRSETESINVEVVAGADLGTFERPGDAIACAITVPPRRQQQLDDEAAALLSDAELDRVYMQEISPQSRWEPGSSGPPWPVPRWYR